MNFLSRVLQKKTPPVSNRVMAELFNRLSLEFDNKILLINILIPAMVIIFWDHVNHTYLLFWALADTLITVDRFLISRRYQQTKPAEDKIHVWVQRMTLNAFAGGLTWGAAGLLLFVEGSLPHQVLLIVIVMGIAAGSIALYFLSFFPQMVYVYAVPAIGMTAARVALEGSLPYQTLSVIMLFYLAMMFQVVKQANLGSVNAINLRFENLDLAEQLRVQKENAELANIAKSKFLAAASHDLRQPLHALSLFASALNERIKFPEVRVLVDNINLSVAALEDLFKALLDISRLDAGVVIPKFQHFRIRCVMERLEAEFSTIARTKGLIFQIDGPDLIAYSDPILLETMLRNLISNAIRFTEKGEVKVIWLILEKQVLISVNDSGIGIPKEDRGRIFEEFMQLNNPGRDRNIGLGLGLAIVKRLSLLLNCEVTVQSISKMGSAFQMLIPKGDAALIVNESGPLEQMIENEPGLLVLVIDDEVSIREGMKALLGNWGHEVVVAGSLAEALQTMEYPPDAILADYRLRDEKNGIAAIKVICKNWGREIPSLIITGDTAPELSSVMQASGMDFMHKPVSPAKLRTFLRSVSRQGSSPD